MIWIIQNIWTNEIKAFKSLTDAAFYMSANHNSIRNKFSKNACNKVIVKDWAVYHLDVK